MFARYALAILLLAVPVTSEECPSAYDLIFVVDGSGSIDGEEYQTQMQFVYDIVSGMDIRVDGANVAVIQYSSSARLEVPMADNKASVLNSVCTDGHCAACYVCGSDYANMHTYWSQPNYVTLQCCDDLNTTCCCYEDGACAIPAMFGATRPSTGLAIAQEQFNANPRGDVPQIIIITTDGQFNDDVVPAYEASKALKDNGVYILAVGVGNSVNNNQLRNTSSGEEYVWHVDDFPDLSTFVDPLLEAACQLTSQSASPSVTPTHSRTPTTSPTLSLSSTISLSPSATPTRSRTPSNSPSVTATPSRTPSPTSSVTPEASRTPSGTPEASRTPSLSVGASPSTTNTATATTSPSLSSSTSLSATSSPSATSTSSASATATSSISISPSVSPTSSISTSPTASLSFGASPSNSPSPSKGSDSGGGGTDFTMVGAVAGSSILLALVAAAFIFKRKPEKRASVQEDKRPKSFFDVHLVVNPLFLRGHQRTQKRLAQVESEMTDMKERAEDANSALNREGSKNNLVTPETRRTNVPSNPNRVSRAFWGRRMSNRSTADPTSPV